MAARIYVASHEGVFVLDRRGDRAAVAAASFAGSIVDCVQPRPDHPEIVFACVTHDGLYRSRDAGLTWQKLFAGDLRAIAVDPTDDGVIYAGTEPVHLHRSEDGGDSWHEITALQRLPEETRRRYGTKEPGARGFEDPNFQHGPQDWTFPIPPHLGHITEIFIRPDDPREIFLSIEHGGIARSVDRGETWLDASLGIDYLDIHRLLRLPLAEDRYVVSSARGLYASDDPVKGWMRAENGVERDYFHEMLLLPNGPAESPPLLVCAADGSPVRWPAVGTGRSWTPGKVGARAALYRSDDGARSWRRIGAGSGLPEEMGPMIWSLRLDPGDGTLYAGTGEVARGFAEGTGGCGAILASNDEGETWRTIIADLPAVRQIAVATN